MTGDELRAALQRLDLSQVDLGHLTGKDAVTVNRWAHGRLPVPVYARTILRLMEALLEFVEHEVAEAHRILEKQR